MWWSKSEIKKLEKQIKKDIKNMSNKNTPDGALLSYILGNAETIPEKALTHYWQIPFENANFTCFFLELKDNFINVRYVVKYFGQGETLVAKCENEKEARKLYEKMKESKWYLCTALIDSVFCGAHVSIMDGDGTGIHFKIYPFCCVCENTLYVSTHEGNAIKMCKNEKEVQSLLDKMIDTQYLEYEDGDIGKGDYNITHSKRCIYKYNLPVMGGWNMFPERDFIKEYPKCSEYDYFYLSHRYQYPWPDFLITKEIKEREKRDDETISRFTRKKDFIEKYLYKKY